MGRDEIINIITEICRSYTDILGRVILFGSFSRGEAKDNSDIDLYIEPKDTSVTTAKFGSNQRYRDFKFELYSMIPRSFDMLAYGGKRDLGNMKKSPLWTQIEKDGIVLYDQRTETL